MIVEVHFSICCFFSLFCSQLISYSVDLIVYFHMALFISLVFVKYFHMTVYLDRYILAPQELY
jgi:hypothetical protein